MTRPGTEIQSAESLANTLLKMEVNLQIWKKQGIRGTCLTTTTSTFYFKVLLLLLLPWKGSSTTLVRSIYLVNIWTMKQTVTDTTM